MSASYLDLHLEIDNGGILKTKLYDTRDDFAFPIVNFPLISSSITTIMEFTFHNSDVFLELVPSPVVFSTELSC
jgi:hypothetical protein